MIQTSLPFVRCLDCGKTIGEFTIFYGDLVLKYRSYLTNLIEFYDKKILTNNDNKVSEICLNIWSQLGRLTPDFVKLYLMEYLKYNIEDINKGQTLPKSEIQKNITVINNQINDAKKLVNDYKNILINDIYNYARNKIFDYAILSKYNLHQILSVFDIFKNDYIDKNYEVNKLNLFLDLLSVKYKNSLYKVKKQQSNPVNENELQEEIINFKYDENKSYDYDKYKEYIINNSEYLDVDKLFRKIGILPYIENLTGILHRHYGNVNDTANSLSLNQLNLFRTCCRQNVMNPAIMAPLFIDYDLPTRGPLGKNEKGQETYQIKNTFNLRQQIGHVVENNSISKIIELSYGNDSRIYTSSYLSSLDDMDENIIKPNNKNTQENEDKCDDEYEYVEVEYDENNNEDEEKEKEEQNQEEEENIIVENNIKPTNSIEVFNRIYRAL